MIVRWPSSQPRTARQARRCTKGNCRHSFFLRRWHRSGRTAQTGTAPERQQLKITLADEGVAATIEDDDTLTVERLGQTYRIRPGEEIEGNGALRAQLETIVADAD
jgi:hypothetical protein